MIILCEQGSLLFALLLLDFFVAGGIAAAAATRGQWKQTKSAIAPLTPSGAHYC